MFGAWSPVFTFLGPLGYCSKFCQNSLPWQWQRGGASETPSASDSLTTFLWLAPPSVLLGVCCSHQDVVPNSMSTFCTLDPMLFQVIVGTGREEGQSLANSSTADSHTPFLVLCLQPFCVHAFLYVQDKTQIVKYNSIGLHTGCARVLYTFCSLAKRTD